MEKDDGMVHKIAFVWAVVITFVALAGGFAFGMYWGRGELKEPAAGASYELAIVAKSGKGIGVRYHAFEKYYPEIKELKRGLLSKRAIFDNGSFRIEGIEQKNK